MSDLQHYAIEAFGMPTTENVYNFLRDCTDLEPASRIRLASFMGEWHAEALKTVARAAAVDAKYKKAGIKPTVKQVKENSYDS